MARYTMTLGEIVDDYKEDIFDFEYPEWVDDSGKEKDILEKMFIDHYYFHEIGVETIEMFKKRLQSVWLETIDNYNFKMKSLQMLESESVLKQYWNRGNAKTTLKDLPVTEYVEDNYATAIQKNESETEGSNVSPVDLVNNFIKKLVNVRRNYIDSFKKLFMGVY